MRGGGSASVPHMSQVTQMGSETPTGQMENMVMPSPVAHMNELCLSHGTPIHESHLERIGRGFGGGRGGGVGGGGEGGTVLGHESYHSGNESRHVSHERAMTSQRHGTHMGASLEQSLVAPATELSSSSSRHIVHMAETSSSSKRPVAHMNEPSLSRGKHMDKAYKASRDHPQPSHGQPHGARMTASSPSSWRHISHMSESSLIDKYRGHPQPSHSQPHGTHSQDVNMVADINMVAGSSLGAPLLGTNSHNFTKEPYISDKELYMVTGKTLDALSFHSRDPTNCATHWATPGLELPYGRGGRRGDGRGSRHGRSG